MKTIYKRGLIKTFGHIFTVYYQTQHGSEDAPRKLQSTLKTRNDDFIIYIKLDEPDMQDTAGEAGTSS